MSSKIGLILSSIFVVLFFAFGIDLITIQFVYSDLDSKGTAISYMISQHGSVDETLIKNIEEKYNLEFTCLSSQEPLFGDVVDYSISKEIKTLIISNKPMHISIKRNAVIGYFG